MVSRPLFLLLAGFLLLLSAPHGGAVDREMQSFATENQKQIRELSKSLTNPVPELVWSFFDAVRVDDWMTSTNLAERLTQGHNRAFVGGSDGNDPMQALASLIWAPICEMIGANEQFHDWDRKWLHRFGHEVISVIPKGAIYFGGTDPGRFVIHALSTSGDEEKKIFLLTQNQLSDYTYIDYLRKTLGDSIKLMSYSEQTNIYAQFLLDAKIRVEKGKLLPGEDIRIVNGAAQIRGPVAIMAYSGWIARRIMENNPDKDFYYEESFRLDWMYPYLTPVGPIFHLAHKTMDHLDRASIQKNDAFWKKLTADAVGGWISAKTSVTELCNFSDRVVLGKNYEEFKGDRSFIGNEDAQKTFSKLRSAIGNLYAWRAAHSSDEDEKAFLWEEAELAFRQAFAFCPSSPETIYSYITLLNSRHRPDDALLLTKTGLRLDEDNQYLKDLVRYLHDND